MSNLSAIINEIVSTAAFKIYIGMCLSRKNAIQLSVKPSRLLDHAAKDLVWYLPSVDRPGKSKILLAPADGRSSRSLTLLVHFFPDTDKLLVIVLDTKSCKT